MAAVRWLNSWRKLRGVARTVAALPFVVLPFLVRLPHGHAEQPVVRVGDGPAALIFYDSSNSVIRRVEGFQRLLDCSPNSRGTILLAQEQTPDVLEIDSQGAIVSKRTLPVHPSTVRANSAGEMIVTTPGAVSLVGSDGIVKHSVKVEEVSEADFSPGGFIAARAVHSHSLVRMDWAGNIIKQSAAGKEEPGYLPALFSLDSNEDGTALVSEGLTAVLVDQDLTIKKRIDVGKMRNRTLVRLENSGKALVLAGPVMRLGILDQVGNLSVFSSSMESTCGGLLKDGGYVVGMIRKKEGSWSHGKSRNQAYIDNAPSFAADSLAGVLLGCAAIAYATVMIVRRRCLWRAGSLTKPAIAEGDEGARSVTTSSLPINRPMKLKLLFWLAIGTLASWTVLHFVNQLQVFDFWSSLGWIVSASLVLSIALLALARMAGADRDFFEFKAKSVDRTRSNRCLLALLLLAIISLGVSLYMQARVGDTKVSIGLWIAAQILFLGAFMSNGRRNQPLDKTTATLGVVILLVSVVTRFWQIGSYPDRIHHDHGFIGMSALMLLLGDWSPFFVVDPLTQTLTRPWLLQMAGIFHLFGAEAWTLRLSSAVWGVILVVSCYALGSALSSRRLGIIFAAIISVQHSLLLYTRQPYVTESTAPFVLSIYFIVMGLREGSLRSWAWAGLWIAYSMMSIRQCTLFPFIWIALFLCFVAYAPRLLWQRRWGLLVAIGGAVIAYAPFLRNTFSATNQVFVRRLEDQSPLFGPNFSLNPDLSVWASQFGKSFGSLLLFRDSAPWGVSANAPIFVGSGAACFCVGVLYLLLRARNPILMISTAPIVISITLGSALLVSPPTYYHFFVGITFAGLIASVPLERLWSIAAACKVKVVKVLLGTIVFATLGAFYYDNLSLVRATVARPPAVHGLPGMWAPEAHSLLARYVSAHKGARFYLVTNPDPNVGFSSGSAIFYFFGFYSDISDLTYGMEDYLPLRPDDNQNAVFVILPERLDAKQALQEVYPQGEWSKIFFGSEAVPLDVFTVQGRDLQEAFTVGRRPVSRGAQKLFEIRSVS